MKFLGPLQLRVMQQFWFSEKRPEWFTPKQVMEALNNSTTHPTLAYTSVSTVLISLIKSGFLQRQKSARYSPAYEFNQIVEAQEYEQSIFIYLTHELHAGDIRLLEQAVSDFVKEAYR